MPVFVITGTDTGVGKTYVACGLARALRGLGIDTGVFKPFCCGPRDDVIALRAAAGVADTLDEINPCHLAAPLAPLRAAELAGGHVDIAASLDAFDMLRHRHDVLLVEGVGGLMVPLCVRDDEVYSFRDYCGNLAGALVIVARRSLGTLNHTWLTVQACREAGLTIGGVLVNDATPVVGDESAAGNPDLLARCTRVPVLGCIAHGAPPDAFHPLARLLAAGASSQDPL